MNPPVCEASSNDRLIKSVPVFYHAIGFFLLMINDTHTLTKNKEENNDHLLEEQDQQRSRVHITNLYQSCYTQCELVHIFSPANLNVEKEKDSHHSCL